MGELASPTLRRLELDLAVARKKDTAAWKACFQEAAVASLSVWKMPLICIYLWFEELACKL